MASAFNLLTSGGARFDKNRFKKDIDLFTGVGPSSTVIPFLLLEGSLLPLYEIS
jgi:hypothetical protein